MEKGDEGYILLDDLELSDVRFLEDSIAWKAIVELLEIRIKESLSILEISVDIDLIKNAQGRISEIRSLLRLPETVKEQIEMNKEKEKKE